MNIKQKVDDIKGFTLLEIIIVVFILGLLAIPMFNLISSMMFSTSKENIKTDLGNKGRSMMEEILFNVRDVPTTYYVEVYDNTLTRLTTKNDIGTILKITDKAFQPNTTNASDIWYSVYMDLTTGKKYLLKYPQSAKATISANWRNYIFMDRIKSFSITIEDTAVASNRLYDKYKISMQLEYGKSAKDIVNVNIDKEFIKYTNK